jgi:DNA-binding MarR family transcriptional regulator
MANKVEKISSPKTKKALTFWQGVNTIALQRMPVDLSARQTSTLLHVYLNAEPHTIKSLSEILEMSKPAVCRAIDALETAKLVKRTIDRSDRRNVLIARTAKGTAYVQEFADIIMMASKEAA